MERSGKSIRAGLRERKDSSVYKEIKRMEMASASCLKGMEERVEVRISWPVVMRAWKLVKRIGGFRRAYDAEGWF
jgi:hypothetical protein